MSAFDEDRSVYYSGHVPDFDDDVVEELLFAAMRLRELLEGLSSVGASVSLVWEACRLVGCDVETNGLLHPVRLHQTVNLTEEAKLLKMCRGSLYSRVVRAEARGKDTPFWRAMGGGGEGVLVARSDEILRWPESWTGRQSRRKIVEESS